MKRFLLSIFLYLPLNIYCQTTIIDGGISVGMSLYQGDMTPRELADNLEHINPAASVFGRINFPLGLSIKAAFQYTTLSGDDNNDNGNRQRRLRFKSEILESTLTAEWNFVRRGKFQNSSIYPFIYAGVGTIYFNPRINFDGQNLELQPLGTEGQGLPGYPDKYERFQAVVPFGGGFKIEIQNFGQIALELGFRKTFTDYLDDISGVEVNYLDLLAADRLVAAQISRPRIDPNDPDPEEIVYIRGNFPKDWYYTLNFSVAVPLATLYGNAGIKCPKL